MHGDHRLGLEAQHAPRQRAAAAKVALLERAARSKAKHLDVIGVVVQDVGAEPRGERLGGALGEPALKEAANDLEQIDAVARIAAGVEFLEQEPARVACEAAGKPDQGRLDGEPGQVGCDAACDLGVAQCARQVAAPAHGARKEQVQPRVRRLAAREVLEHGDRLGHPPAGEVNARDLERERSGHGAPAELLGQQRGGLGRPLGQQQKPRELGTGAAKARTLGDGAAKAMLGAPQVAARQQAARNLEMRRRGPLDRIKRHVVGRLGILMAAKLREAADEQRRGGLALRIDAQRPLERGDRVGVLVELGEQHALRQPRVARRRQQARRLAVLRQRLVVPADRLERPAELQHPVAARRIAGHRGAQFALGILEPALTEHLTGSARVLFASALLGHECTPRVRR